MRMRRGLTKMMTRAASSAAGGAAERQGYQAFGSFHSESADSLFASAVPAPPPAFLPPLPRDCRVALPRGAGRSNAALFALDLEHWTYLNHGAFGGATRFASRVATAWRDAADRQPLRFHDRELFAHVVAAIRAIAALINVPNARELVLLHNATSGLHAVLDSVLRHRQGECQSAERVVVCFSTRYGAVRKMIRAAQEDAINSESIRLVEISLSLAESYDDAAVLEKLRDALNSESKPVDLVIVDHVTSNTGVLLPVDAIVKECHARDAPVLVDGAHALLNLDLDVARVGADYYVGNCHKWFCSPRGAAFLHVNTRGGLERTARIPIHPRVVSHGFFDGMQSAFMWTGLQDYSAWLSLPKCVEFWQQQDIQQCRQYMHTLVQDATELLYEEWGMLEELASAKHFPLHKWHAMRLVKLPTARPILAWKRRERRRQQTPSTSRTRCTSASASKCPSSASTACSTCGYRPTCTTLSTTTPASLERFSSDKPHGFHGAESYGIAT
jgi:isopenicillin-N epimerase